MGDISKKLHRKLASKADNLPTREPKRRPGELLPGGFKDMQMLIKDGLAPQATREYPVNSGMSGDFPSNNKHMPIRHQFVIDLRRHPDFPELCCP